MAETVLQDEQTFVENEFGTVTSKRVIYYRAKGWFSGGSREDIPLQHVTSVRLDIVRRIPFAILLFLLGFIGLKVGGGATVISLLPIVVGILFIWGSPTVVVNTSGRDLKAEKGLPWKRAAATTFVETLRQQLFNKPGA